MKAKSWSKYFLIIILILVMVFWGQYVLDGITRNSQKTYNINPYFYNMVMIIFYGSIGLLLGLEHLIQEIKKEGTWVINIPKLILMGIPSLYFSLGIFLYGSRNQFVREVIAYPIGILLNNSTNFIFVLQLIFGYSIITSFYKKMKKGDNSNKV